MQSTTPNRRQFLKATGYTLAGSLCLPELLAAEEAPQPRVAIQDVAIGKGVAIRANDGTTGRFAGSPSQNLKALEEHLPQIRKLLLDRDPLDMKLCGELLWEAVYPGRARLYAEGRDPLTGESILNKPRRARHTATGQIFMAFSTVDIALWDLRAKLLRKRPIRSSARPIESVLPSIGGPARPTRG